MVVLGDTKIKEFLENIFNAHGFPEKLNERHYVCYECKALLSKSYNFIQKALRAQTAIENLQQQKFTDEHSWKMLRDSLGLNSNLSCCSGGITIFLKAEDYEQQNEDYDTKGSLVPHLHSNLNSDKVEAGSMGQYHLCSTFICPSSNDNDDSCAPVDKSNPIKHEYYVEVDCIKTETFEDENCEPYTHEKPIKMRKNKSKKRSVSKKDRHQKLSIIKPKQSPKDMTVQRTGKRKYIKKYSRRKNSSPKKIKEYSEKYRSSDSDSEIGYETYDEEGKRIRRPKEEPRVYPRKCEHCDYIIEAGKYHYYHYVNDHPTAEYPYMRKDRRYVCQFCGIGKKYMSELREHEMIHGGEKAFVCPKCGKSFCNKKQLRAHNARVHVEPRLFCEYCNKGFKEKSVLKLHIRTHTGEKPYKCPICGAGFAHGGNVGVHMRNVHQQDGSKAKPRGREPRPPPRAEPLNLLTDKPEALVITKLTS